MSRPLDPKMWSLDLSIIGELAKNSNPPACLILNTLTQILWGWDPAIEILTDLPDDWFKVSSRSSGLHVPLYLLIMPNELFFTLWLTFVPLANWTLPLHGHLRLYILIMQFTMGCLAGWNMGWFPVFTPHETRNEGKHRVSSSNRSKAIVWEEITFLF